MENEIFNLDYKDQNLKIERFDLGGPGILLHIFPW